MFRFAIFLVALLFAGSFVNRAIAEPIEVQLIKQKNLRKGIAAFPRLSEGHPAASSLNKILAKSEADVVEAAKECGGSTRTIKVTMAGPRFVSYLVTDDYFCGAYPTVEQFALTFDLQEKQLVNWKKTFPAKMIEKSDTSVEYNVDKTVIGSAILNKRYVQAFPGSSKDADASCKQMLEDDLDEGTFSFEVWLDAATRSLVIQKNNYPHAFAACQYPVNLPLGELQREGYAKALIDALAAAGPPTK